MKISEMITDRYKLRIPPTVYYDLLADVREVEEEQEPRKGHWIDCDNSDNYSADGYDCSVCGVNAEYATSYCPNCGCRMVEPQESEGMTREEAIKLLTQYIDYDAETPDYYKMEEACKVAIKALEQEPKCNSCKWWKDSDGEYRRGCGAESQCPINRREVFKGNGYCFLFEPQESEG